MPAIAVHHTATVDEPWDGPAAVAAMPNDDAVLRYCHAWQTQEAADEKHVEGDDDADDQKGSYKFPHAKTKGGPANIPACRNGLARLAGANIPDADRDGVKAHLQAHIDDFEKKNGSSDDTTRTGLVNAGADAFASYGRMTAAARVKAGLPRAQRLSARADWFRFTDASDGSAARLDVYDEIGWWGVTAADFGAQLAAISAPRLAVHINSPGGDVFDGLAILNMLRGSEIPVDVVIDGLAASAASFIAMAGESVTMMPQSQMMIHDASGLCMGNASDMTSMAQLLERVSDNIAAVYASRAGGTTASWRTPMKAETWYGPEEAVTAGLADKVGEHPNGKKKPSQTPDNAWNLSFYAYSGREKAPEPGNGRVADQAPEAPSAPRFSLTAAELRAAMILEGAA
jgi:ATP-dependent protease ClpP protease subunit